MNSLSISSKKVGYISNITIIITAFCSAFYPRIIETAGAPPVINFIHYLIVPFAFALAISTTPTKNQRQISISWEIITTCIVLLGVMFCSALLNHAGIINIILDYLLLLEPFLILLAIVSIPLSPTGYQRLRNWVLISGVINLVLAYAQRILMDIGIIRVASMTIEDNVQGVFYSSGAGNYVSSAVSVSVALYYWASAKKTAVWIKIFWLLAAFYQLLISDSKQILITFIIAWLLLLFTKYQYFDKVLTYLIGIILFLFSFIWAIQNLNLPGLSAFKYWAGRTELYGLNGIAVQTKLAGIKIIISHFTTPLNWFFGLGPGHSIGRLGGWVIREYFNLLTPLGVTTHPASSEAWTALKNSWLALESSMFSPLFSLGGIWGDLGFIGLVVYLYLAYIVWSRLCVHDVSKLLMLSLFIFGLILTQMEEPGQTLTVAILIALQWHERNQNFFLIRGNL